ncbi:TAXI family TRAP transporter solute-binding subunit [Roseomonas sp. OT10]|uniref:TAXI family TRAP transporter solute-binding subunit n=1 Tax=Roseomonas cutis TaxID=2897332 RepID=UPI001E64621A|nr:TAXI family TRAP transporter solute-binding subunit [Roseomonas sp. OT10]UFN47052.1 TAXI family TRAP transporter solute-binding subunit [Roseomonas sp. OT10]
MVTRRTGIAGALAAAALGFAGPARAQAPGWPQVLVLATASPGGTYHAYGRGLAKVLGRALGLPISLRETSGPAENIRLLEAGEAHIAFVTLGAALRAWSGGEETGGQPMRAMHAAFAMYDTPFHFLARRDSAIDSLSALDGKRLGVGPEGGTGATYTPPMLAALGLRAQPVHGSWEALAEALRAGQIDALAVAAGTPFPAVADLEAKRAIRYLPLSRAQIRTIRLALPELGASTIPPGTYPSLMEGYETVGLYNLAVVHRSLPVDLVYDIVRAVFDAHAEMMEAHPAAAATVPANFTHNTLLPFHPGALRYYGNRAVPGTVIGD